MAWRDAGLGAGAMLVLSLLGYAWSLHGASEEDPSAEAATAAELGRLRSEVEATRRVQVELTTRLSWLEYRLDHPEVETSDSAAPALDPAQLLPGAAPEPGRPEAAYDEVPADVQALAFDAGTLLAAGVPAGEVEALRALFDASELDLLDLGDIARREGWIDTPRYYRELHALRSGLRSDLGDRDFDRLLYATGRPNRIVVSEVMEGSPAEAWGLEAGDVIRAYAETPVFRGRELQARSSQGPRGEPVAIDILRDGRPLRIRGERGPLGIRLQLARIPPEEGR